MDFTSIGISDYAMRVEIPTFSTRAEAIKWANEQDLTRDLRKALFDRLNINLVKIQEITWNARKFRPSDMDMSADTIKYTYLALKIILNRIGDSAMNGASVYCGSEPVYMNRGYIFRR